MCLDSFVMPLNLHRFDFFCLKGGVSYAARKRVFQLPRSVHECIMQACQEVTPADFAAYMQFHYRNLEVEGSFLVKPCRDVPSCCIISDRR